MQMWCAFLGQRPREDEDARGRPGNEVPRKYIMTLNDCRKS